MSLVTALQTFFTLVVKILTKAQTYLDIAKVVIAWCDVFIPQVVDFITAQVRIQDDKLAGLPALTEPELDAKKELAFKTVERNTLDYFSASPSYVPKGIVGMLIKAIVHVEHNQDFDEDERADRARSLGVFRIATDEETKDIVEQGLNKGWTSFGKE